MTVASDFTLPAGGPAFHLDVNTAGTTVTGPGMFSNADTVYIRQDLIDVVFINQGVLRAYEANGGSTFSKAFTNTATGEFTIEVQNTSSVALTSPTGLSNAGTITITQRSAGNLYGSTLNITAGTLVNTGTIRSTFGVRSGRRAASRISRRCSSSRGGRRRYPPGRRRCCRAAARPCRPGSRASHRPHRTTREKPWMRQARKRRATTDAPASARV